MSEFDDALVTQIDERLKELEHEVAQLERARAVLTEDRGTGARPAGSSRRSGGRRPRSTPPPSPTASRRSGSRSAPGGTTTAVLAALAGGEAMTATEVAAKAGLPRPTVSTTLSKLARNGRVEKADRGYRLVGEA